MENEKRSFGEWISYVVFGIGRGAGWFFGATPLTALVVLLSVGNMSSRMFIVLVGAMIIDGYLGNRKAERNEQLTRQIQREQAEERAKESEKSKGE
jgi:hypothetical protein